MGDMLVASFTNVILGSESLLHFPYGMDLYRHIFFSVETNFFSHDVKLLHYHHLLLLSLLLSPHQNDNHRLQKSFLNPFIV